MCIRFILTLLAIGLLCGCSYSGPRLAKVQTQSDERSRELTQAALLSNSVGKQRQAAAQSLVQAAGNTNLSAQLDSASKAFSLSGDFLRRNQSMIGLPIVDQTSVVEALLSENKAIREKAEADQRKLETQEQTWAAKEQEYQSKLQEMGRQLEAERNKTIVKRIWTWSLATFGIGGLIALCVFFPALIPLVGHLIGWVVGKIPTVAGAVGVVSVNAFDSVVAGVQNGKKALEEKSDAKAIDTELSKKMDQAHKNLVRARKKSLGVPELS